MRRDLLAIAIALALAGCTRDLCGRNSDCAGGQVCGVGGLCAVAPDAPGAGSDSAIPDTHVPPDAPQTESQ